MDHSHQELVQGLCGSQKRIPSKYFYDEVGSNLFNRITRLPEYYLTRSELNVLNQFKADISDYFCSEKINIIELGPGEGTKSKILLEQFLVDDRVATYMPIDVSSEYIMLLKEKLECEFPTLRYQGIVAEYLQGIKQVTIDTEQKKLILFLGSSIGNFSKEEADHFFLELKNSMNVGDLLYVGFDLCNDTQALNMAYNDSQGVTTEFNLNVLRHINRECSANFCVEKFTHKPNYNKQTNAMESYLVSQANQTIKILGQEFEISVNEEILTEVSCKYTIADVNEFASRANFEVVRHFYDSDQKFLNSLWIIR